MSAQPSPQPASLHVAITGGSGLIGSRLIPHLTAAGHRVTQLVRRPPAPGQVRWDPAAGRLDPAVLRDVDAVVHLSGAPISQGWTGEQRGRIRDSRADTLRLLATTIARMPTGARPRTLISASGTNYYGDRGEEVVTEETGPGTGYMAEVCRAWEAAADPARAAGLRVVHLRTGVVLAAGGGAFGRMVPFAKLGVLGRFGSGRQYWPWITVDDVVGFYAFALERDDVAGALNGCSPNPARNAELTRALTTVLHRPMLPLALPRIGPTLMLGPDIARDLLYASIRAVPERATRLGYVFRHPTLEPALRAVLAR